MVDANKTAETRQITELASRWLSERGFKPVESEVPIAEKWTADIAGCGELTRTECTNLKIIPRRPKQWSGTELDAWNAQFNAIEILTAAIEVKVSKADFARDDKWSREWPISLLYLAAPAKLLAKIDVPDGVGILSCGDSCRCVRPSRMNQVSHKVTLSTVHAIAVRRDHFTAHARFREFNRQAAERENERVNRARFGTMVDVIVDVIVGEQTVQDALRMRGIKIDRNGDVVRRLERAVLLLKTKTVPLPGVLP